MYISMWICAIYIYVYVHYLDCVMCSLWSVLCALFILCYAQSLVCVMCSF